jgi:hypothetical protein
MPPKADTQAAAYRRRNSDSFATFAAMRRGAN